MNGWLIGYCILGALLWLALNGLSQGAAVTILGDMSRDVMKPNRKDPPRWQIFMCGLIGFTVGWLPIFALVGFIFVFGGAIHYDDDRQREDDIAETKDELQERYDDLDSLRSQLLDLTNRWQDRIARFAGYNGYKRAIEAVADCRREVLNTIEAETTKRRDLAGG